MQATITISIRILTDGDTDDINAIAAQLEDTLKNEFVLDLNELKDKEPVITVGEPEISTQ